VVGTSIGAVNGAAIAQGISAADLEAFWLSLQASDVEGLPSGMGPVARAISNWILRRSIGSPLAQISAGRSQYKTPEEYWLPTPLFSRFLADRFLGRWNSFLDTTPLWETLATRLGLDERKIAASSRMLLINATNVRTGQGVIFSNRPLLNRMTGLQRTDCRVGITLRRIVASCSIPLIYPWTQDQDGDLYWDGALVANTPLGASFDAVHDRPLREPMEVLVVLLNPWWDQESPAPRSQPIPRNFAEAAAWALDWTMLSSFRVSLRMLHVFNQIAQHEVAAGLPSTYRLVKLVMVAPEDFLPVERIIDYDPDISEQLIAAGYAAAERAFQKAFPAQG
jgi:NTE family protein